MPESPAGTTLVASAYGASLYLAPWWTPDIDEGRIREVFRAHRVKLVDPGVVTGKLEFVAAAGLSADRATAFARDLRDAGLNVRVVNDPQITQSARLSNALALCMLVAMFTFPIVLPALIAIVNLLTIWTNGVGLPMAGSTVSGESLEDRVHDMIDVLEPSLADDVVASLRAQARALGRDAELDPEGPAAGALREVLADLGGKREAEVAARARRLKDDLRRARAAASEVGAR